MLIPHHSEVRWRPERWPNFDPREFACSHCGEFWWDPAYFDAIQNVRSALGRPLRINSAHRCWFHNQLVGGAILSEHKKIALDLDLGGHDPHELLEACKAAGFSSFGLYRTFLHVDRRPGRFWASKGSDETWNG